MTPEVRGKWLDCFEMDEKDKDCVNWKVNNLTCRTECFLKLKDLFQMSIQKRDHWKVEADKKSKNPLKGDGAVRQKGNGNSNYHS